MTYASERTFRFASLLIHIEGLYSTIFMYQIFLIICMQELRRALANLSQMSNEVFM